MKHILITTIAAVVLVGCATIQSPEALSDFSIRQAAWDGDIKAVKQHLAAGVDVDEMDLYGETSLHYAADKGHKEIVELLIANGADVNVKLKSGSMIKDNKPYRAKSEETTLHEVARSYSEKHASEVCELLIANGAKVNELNDKGQTPIDEALANGRKKTAEFLRKHGGKTGEELKAEGKSG